MFNFYLVLFNFSALKQGDKVSQLSSYFANKPEEIFVRYEVQITSVLAVKF